MKIIAIPQELGAELKSCLDLRGLLARNPSVNKPNSSQHSHVVFNQLSQLIPVGMVPNLTLEFGGDKRCQIFSAWSQVVSLLYA